MPKGFEFRFENLLSFKIKKEDEAKMQLSESVQAMELEKSKLSSLQKQYEHALIRWNESTSQQFRVSDIQTTSNHIKWLSDMIEIQEKLLQSAEENVEKCRLILVEAKKETRKFEKIKEKDYELFQQAEQKMEIASIDQFVSHRNSQR